MTQNKKDVTGLHVINNEDGRQFEIRLNDMVAKIPYNFRDDMIALFHTEVPEELRGHGLASRLAEYALNYAKDHQLKVLPYCPFVSKYIKEHPEWKYIVKHFD